MGTSITSNLAGNKSLDTLEGDYYQCFRQPKTDDLLDLWARALNKKPKLFERVKCLLLSNAPYVVCGFCQSTALCEREGGVGSPAVTDIVESGVYIE